MRQAEENMVAANAQIDGLYGKLIEGGIGYFFPSVNFEPIERDPRLSQGLIAQETGSTSVVLNWFGSPVLVDAWRTIL